MMWLGAHSGPWRRASVWLQTSMGYTATAAGQAAAFNGALALVMSPVAARLLGMKVDPRFLVFIGVMGLGLVGLWRSQFSTSVTFWPTAASPSSSSRMGELHDPSAGQNAG